MAVSARASVRAAVVLVLLAGASPRAEAQFLKDYKDGLDAAEAKNWQASADAMRRAIAERAEEKANLPSRAYFKPYLPHYHLGRALFELGDCAGATAAWSESERQAVIADRPEIDVVRAKREECATRARDASRAAADRDAAGALAEAESAAAELAAFAAGDGRAVWDEGAPPLARRQRAIEERLASARRRLADGRRGEEAAFSEAADLARRASAEIADLRRAATDLLGERSAQIGERVARIDELSERARALLERTAPLDRSGALVRRARADLAGLVAERERAAGPQERSYLDGLASRLASSIGRLEEITVAPPASLLGAADAYFRGDYAATIERLSAAPSGDARSRAHALLLRAAARYSLWVEGGESDDSLLTAATADAAACRALGAKLVLPTSLFSPRFRQFFEAAVAPEVAAGTAE